MDHMIQYEKKPPGGPDYHSVENALLMQVSSYLLFTVFVAGLKYFNIESKQMFII